MSPFIKGNMRVRAIKSIINNVVKFFYSLGPILQSKYYFNNCYYLSKKHFARATI